MDIEANSPPWPRIVVWAWIIAAVLNAAAALIQYSGASNILSPWITVSDAGEAYGNLRQRNQFASLTNMGLAALIWGYVRPWRQVWTTLPWVQFCIALLVTANAASGSRTGLVQLILVLALFVIWRPRDRPLLSDSRFIVASIGYAVAAVVFGAMANVHTLNSGGILGRMQDVSSHCSGRMVLWSNVVYLVGLRPWTGWGWGELDYAHFMTLYPGERFCDILDNAHNLPLHLAVELGIPTALLFCTLFAWWLWKSAPWAERRQTAQLAWTVLLIIGLHSLLEYPLWYGPFQLAVGLCLLLLTHRPRAIQNEGIGKENIGTGFHGNLYSFRSAVAVLSLIGLAAAGWDYWRVSQLYKRPEHRAAAYRENTLEKVRSTWFFKDQVQFAEMATASLERGNALQYSTRAKKLLHFSPEPRVVEAIIESAVMLGKDEEALYYLQRYKAAFPEAHAQWAAASARDKAP